MPEAPFDPYAVLGVPPEVSDLELRRAYRALVKRHHPDHNGGSPESARRFAEIQSAYAAVLDLRHATLADLRHAAPATGARPSAAPPPPASDPGLDRRIADLERELAARREAERHRMEERATLAGNPAERSAPADRPRRHPTPEELGYYSTDDSLTKIIDDAAEQLGQRLRDGDAKQQFARRLADLFGRDR